MTVDNPLLRGLSSTLQAFATAPHPDALAAAMVEHLAEPLGVSTAAVLAALPPRMVIVGFSGYQAHELEGLDAIPLDSDYPVPRAYREGEILIEETRTMPEVYEGMRRQGARSRSVIERLPASVTASGPICSRGVAIGGYSVVCTKTQWSTLDLSALDAIGNALGMWLTHPDSGFPTESSCAPPTLTARQRGILSMLGGGMSNPAIAQALGVSESTIKQEVRVVQHALGAGDRTSAVQRAVRLGLLPEPGRIPEGAS